MRIVADTSVLAAGLGRDAPPGQLADAVLGGQARLVTSPALLGELAGCWRASRAAGGVGPGLIETPKPPAGPS